MGLDRISGKEFVEEASVAVVFARIRGEGDIHVPHPRLALKGLKTPAEEAGKRTHLDAGAREDGPRMESPRSRQSVTPLMLAAMFFRGRRSRSDGVKIVERAELLPVGADQILPDGPADLLSPATVRQTGFPRAMSMSKNGPRSRRRRIGPSG